MPRLSCAGGFRRLFFFFSVILLGQQQRQQLLLVTALQQDLALDVLLSDAAPTQARYTALASIATFGPLPRMTAAANTPGTVVLPPDDNPLLCHNISQATPESSSMLPPDSIVLVPRGVCTFQSKVYHAQQLGAKAVLVYGTLASRYALNETDNNNKDQYTYDDIIFPTNYSDYDCTKGQAYLDSNLLSFDPLPYNAAQNDPLLQGPTSLCRDRSPDKLANCPSQACLLTGEQDNNSQNNRQYKACCAWDLHIFLYGDNSQQNVNIPSAYISMQQGNTLLQQVQTNSRVTVTLYARWRPQYNIASGLIWAMGVAACALAAYLSAHDYHKYTARLLKRQKQATDETSNSAAAGNRQPERPTEAPIQEELTIWHALVFIVMASSCLLILFYFKIYSAVKVMYALGCSNATAAILIGPLLKMFMRKTGWRNRVVWRTGTEDFGDITLRDVISHSIGYALGLAWLVVSFTVRHPDRLTFFWITQDVFGVCMCVLFLQVIKLNSLKVASALLIVAFFYDIFFVFISPLIFRKSVMIDVATSGGPPTADPLWCEKYPHDKNCQGGDPLPMLLTMPRLFDYEGGSNLLGLGDIVLPGLLVSYAARFDAAKSLLGVMRGGNGANHCPERHYCRLGGYFWPLVVAYGIGLAMANIAVYLMQMGQPALLYLVPCCLGIFCLLGWWRGEMGDLWDAPKAIRAADTIVYGESSSSPSTSSSQHAPVLAEEGLEGHMLVPSAQDDDDDANDDHA